MYSAIKPLHFSIIIRKNPMNVRCYQTTRITLGNEVSKQELNTSHSPSSVFPSGLNDVKINNLEKWALIWDGKYKKFADVPNLVNPSILERARSKARVKLSLYMIALTVIGCGVMMVSGKRAAARGESVGKINEEFHKKYNEDHPDKKP